MMKRLFDMNAASMTRRTFVGSSAAAAAATLVAGSSTIALAEEAAEPAQGETGFEDCEIVYGTCSPECQHHSLKGYVRDGKLVKVECGEVNESPACARGYARVDMANSAERLKMPMKLVGEKGSGQFEEISWDEAYDLIEQKLNEALDKGGSESVCYATGSGNFSALSRDLMGPWASWLGGAQNCTGNTCCAGIDSGLTTILGKRSQTNRNQLDKADYVIAWGNNPAVTLSGYFGRLQTMMDNGGTLCTIDPYLSETADKSQEWIQPWPGSDSALALGMLKVIIDDGLVDEDYLIQHTTAPCLVDLSTGKPAFANAEDETSYQVYDVAAGRIVAHDAASASPALSLEGTPYAEQYVTVYDLIKAEADKWGEETVAQETGVPYEDIARIARDYASADRAIIIENMGGYQRTEYGGYATATQVYLALFTGNIGHEGDGIYDIGGVSTVLKVNSAFDTNPDALKTEGIPRVHFGEFIEEDKPVPINMMFIITTDCAAQWPNSNMVKKGLDKIPFVVTVDQFMTSTGLHSDLVLPCTGVFETLNVTAQARSATLSLSEAGVTPPGEAKSDLEIFAEIADRMGFGEHFNKEPKEYIAHVIEPLGVTYEELEEKKAINTWEMVPDWIAYEGGVFPTTTGKAHLWVKEWDKAGYPAIACHVRPTESALNGDSEIGQKYPLAAVQRKTRSSVHTTFKNLDTMLDMDGHDPVIIVNDADARDRGIASGDKVVVYNDRGEHEGIARVTDHVKQGVVVLENGWSDTTAKSSSSAVTNNVWPTLGTMHACNSTLVNVKKGA